MQGPAPRGSRARQNTLERVGDKDPGANQAHHRGNHLEHRKYPSPPRENKTTRRATQSKGFRFKCAQSAATEDSMQQVCQFRPVAGAAKAHLVTIGSPLQGLPHFCRVPVAVSSPDGAEVGGTEREVPGRGVP